MERLASKSLRTKGLALPLLLMVIAILMSLMGAILSSNSNALLQVREDGDGLAAQFAAEAGAWRAVSVLSEGGVQNSPELLWSEEAMEKVKAAYTVVVTRGPATIEGVSVPDSNHFLVRSEGVTTHEEYPTRHVVTMLVKTGSSGSFDTAVFAQDSILLNNGYTDVFDSNSSPGFSESGNATMAGGGRAATSPASPSSGKAHIGTNSVAENSVILQGNSSVDEGQGDVLVGPGGDDSVVDATAGSYGSVSALGQSRTLNSVELPFAIEGNDMTVSSSQILAPGLYGDVVIDGGELSLSPDSTYQFSSLTIVNDGTLQLRNAPTNDTPNTKVFIKTSLDIAAGSVNNLRGKAEHLQFLAADEADIHLTQAVLSGVYVLYAPGSRVVIDQGSRIKGAVIGREVEIVGDSASQRSGVRYDLTLMGVDLLGGLGGGGASGAQVIHVQSL